MSGNRQYFVYLMTNWNNKVLYVGVTNDLQRRIYEHRNKMIRGFTEKYNVNKLIYFEVTEDIVEAITRKEIKKWRREKKNKMVCSLNPKWKDLGEEIQIG